MKVIFSKTSERSYSVEIHRSNSAPLRINSAPGYSEYMPHDLQHFIVEQALGLQQAIYGQLAAGGDASTFNLGNAQGQDKKQKSRSNKKLKNKGSKLADQGKLEGAISERASCVCTANWLATRKEPILKKQFAKLGPEAESVFGAMNTSEKRLYTKEKIAEINAIMQDLSERWYQLKIGEPLELAW